MNYREREQLEIWWKRLEQGSLIWREWQPYWGDELSGYMLEDDESSYETTAIAWYLEVIGPLVWNFTEQEKLRKLILIRADITSHLCLREVVPSIPPDERWICDNLKVRILRLSRLQKEAQVLPAARAMKLKLLEFRLKEAIAWLDHCEMNEIVTIESKKTAVKVLERRERLMMHPNFRSGMRKAKAKYGWAWNILTLPLDALFSRRRIGQMEMVFDEIELHLDDEIWPIWARTWIKSFDEIELHLGDGVHTQSSKGE